MMLQTKIHTTVMMLLFSLAASQRPKILCLHGGGQPAQGLQQAMRGIEEELSGEFEFVYATAPNAGNLWIRDPPGGKGEPTTDPGWADESIAVIDEIVNSQGPFYGILGYSQGAAFVPVYLSRATDDTFDIAVTFCGYLTMTHTGLLGTVQTEAPFNDIPHLVWMGQNDFLITNSMTTDMAAIFTDPVIVTSNNGGHNVVDQNDPTFETVTSFIRDNTPPPPTSVSPVPAPTPVNSLTQEIPTPTAPVPEPTPVNPPIPERMRVPTKVYNNSNGSRISLWKVFSAIIFNFIIYNI